jgi:zinc transport system substrate-binding protein
MPFRTLAARAALLPSALLASLLAPFLAAGTALAEARVVASVKPLHSLVAGVMEGVGEPTLLVRGAASPHSYALKPSDAEALRRAQLVLWVGESLEGFLAKPLRTLAGSARVVELAAEPGVRTLPVREGGLWGGHDHEHGHGQGREHEAIDGHVWLDPGNAKAIVGLAADRLAGIDPANAPAYRANADRLSARIDALDREIRDALEPVRERPFVVFHDAYHYLEDRYGLRAVGAIAVNPERPPSAKRLREIRATLEKRGAVCVFAEPQFEPAVVRTVVEGTAVRRGVLDPEGANLADGPGLYFELMRANARALKDCLS